MRYVIGNPSSSGISATFTINPSAFTFLMDAGTVAMRKCINYMKVAVRNAAPRDTGTLQDSFAMTTVRSIGKVVGKLETTTQSKERVWLRQTVRGGKLRGMLLMRQRTFAFSGYAAFVEMGTGRFGYKGTDIGPRTAPYLMWQTKWTGQIHRQKTIKGQPAQPYFKKNALPIALDFPQYFKDALVPYSTTP